MTTIDKIRAEIKKRLNWKGKIQTSYYMGCRDELNELLSFLDTLEESENEDLEEEVKRYLCEECSGDDEPTVSEIARHFAEWGEKNAYKAIMNKADEVRDKRFDADYEVKIEPAAGFDLGYINVYREGKLVGQYVEPKEEKKLPDGLEEAAIDFADYARKQSKDYAISAIADYDHGCIDGFKAGAEWQAEQLLKGSPMPEDTVIFQKGVEEGRRLEREDALTIADIEKLHTFLYAVKNNKQGAFTFTRLSDEQYEEVLRRFNNARKEEDNDRTLV